MTDATDTTIEESEPTFICECCNDETPEDEGRTICVGVRFERQAGAYTHIGIYETWCDSCVSNDAVYVDVSFREYTYLRQSDGMMSRDSANDHFHYHESDGEWRDYPEESDDEDESQSDELLSYSTDVIQVLGWPSVSRHQDLLFGVELEMEGKGDTYANDLVQLLGGSRGTVSGAAILKSDGSLDDEKGAELVTLPFTLAHHQRSGIWQAMLSAQLQRVAKSGAGTSNCGIHVHINRAPLSGLTVGKMVVFLNNPDNAAFVSMIAQRQSGGYCQRDEKKKLTSAMPQNRQYCSRYDIINVTGNRTVEVRMFRGNLRPERVLKNIEFCHALVRFCEATGINESQRWGNFHSYVAKHRKEYPNLCGFLAEKNYLPAPRAGLAAVSDI